jgi:hypothetical protein
LIRNSRSPTARETASRGFAEIRGDDALAPATRARFDAHLMECDGCENDLEQFRVTVRCVENIEQDGLDPTLRNRLLDTFRNFQR